MRGPRDTVWTASCCAPRTQSNTPIEQSAEVLRDRGRIVIVGNTRVELAWKAFYEKELEVRYSRSLRARPLRSRLRMGRRRLSDRIRSMDRAAQFRGLSSPHAQRCPRSGGAHDPAIAVRPVHWRLTGRCSPTVPGTPAWSWSIPGAAVAELDAARARPGSGAPRDVRWRSRAPLRRAQGGGVRSPRLDVIGAGNFARTHAAPAPGRAHLPGNGRQRHRAERESRQDHLWLRCGRH